jgi:hypothetical protein
MPIQIKCQCGKALAVKDQFAGKSVKCPACGKGIKVPAAGGSAASSPSASPGVAPTAQAIGTAAAGNPLSDLFDEEGFGSNIAAVCPSCGTAMAAEAVLCTKCGFNKTTGEAIQGHLTPGVDISTGTLALQKAADDMYRADKLQRDMTEGAGLPWWMLALILFVLGSATVLAIMAVMAASRTQGESNFNAMQMFLQLAGTACALVSFGALVRLIVAGFKEDRKTGFLCCTILYLFAFVFQKPKGRIGAFIVMLVTGGIAGFLLAQSQRV